MLPGSQVSALDLSPWLGLVSVSSATSPVHSSLAVAMPCPCWDTLWRLFGPQGDLIFGRRKKRGVSAMCDWPVFSRALQAERGKQSRILSRI